MPLYETMLIARQDLSPAQVDELAAGYAKIITDGDGTVLKTDNWGLKTLGYRIQKNKKGHYVLFNFDTQSPALLEMERLMRLSEDVLRYISVKVDAFAVEEEEPETTDEKKEAA
ncbi:MAG: 30S ribosomal protein S6 [Alphaproteobacteria bacterium]|nr:MAG: 30S ribosomal protein S6 [Alphaproteobacteria bacterium]